MVLRSRRSIIELEKRLDQRNNTFGRSTSPMPNNLLMMNQGSQLNRSPGSQTNLLPNPMQQKSGLTQTPQKRVSTMNIFDQ